MNMEVANIFQTYRKKTALIRFAKQNPSVFTVLVRESLQPKSKEAWRAAWLIGHIQKPNDIRLIPHIDAYLAIIKQCTQGHQRQLLLILSNMQLSEDQEGLAFDSALTIWENIGKIPSVRITAFNLLLSIADNHPELQSEIELWAQPMYTESLSPGIKNSLIRRMKKK